MKLYLVRHGEPSYSPCTARNLKGQGRDLAAIIAAKSGLVTKVVHDLHEWIPDLSFEYSSYKTLKSIYQNFYDSRGVRPDADQSNEYSNWEDIESFRNRVNASLKPYLGIYTSVIVVAHGMVIQSLTGRHIGYGELIQMEYTADMEFPDWEFTPPKNESKE